MGWILICTKIKRKIGQIWAQKRKTEGDVVRYFDKMR